MGIETEYGISEPGAPEANPMLMSGQVVNAYAQPLGNRAGRARWDYEDEAPLRDARGFEMSRALADASQLTDEEDPTLANVILTNGARLYVDHAHPEYSSPEVMRSVTRPSNAPGTPDSRVTEATCISRSPMSSDRTSSRRISSTTSTPYWSSAACRQVWVRMTRSNFS